MGLGISSHTCHVAQAQRDEQDFLYGQAPVRISCCTADPLYSGHKRPRVPGRPFSPPVVVGLLLEQGMMSGLECSTN